MKDAQNLAKLLGHLPPKVFRTFVHEEFNTSLPELNEKDGKRKQRAKMAEALDALPVPNRQRMEEVAEKIVLLCDAPGQDAMDGVQEDIFADEDRDTFDKLANQYERSLWLYRNEPDLFHRALDWRQADYLHQSQTCYDGFVAPKDLTVLEDADAVADFHRKLAAHRGCDVKDIAVQVFRRLRPNTDDGDDIALYQISIHSNRPPESVERVKDSSVVPQEIVRAESSFVTYEPDNGNLEVLSRGKQGREDLAKLVADTLLQSPITGEKVPIKQYDYQSLAEPREFDISGEPVVWVKVTELGYSAGTRSLLVKMRSNDPDDIYTAGRSLVGPDFDYRRRPLTYAKIAVRLRKEGRGRARTVSIVLRGDNKCNIKAKREKDRALCDRLLVKWGLVKEIGSVESPHPDASAA